MREINAFNLYELSLENDHSKSVRREMSFSDLSLPLASTNPIVYADCHFKHVQFVDSHSSPIAFLNCTFKSCNFDSATLSNVTFTNAKIETSSFRQTEFHNTLFNQSDIHSSDFRCAKFKNVQMYKVRIEHSSFDYAYFDHVIFQRAALNGEENSLVQAKLDTTLFFDCSLPPELLDPRIVSMENCCTFVSDPLKTNQEIETTPTAKEAPLPAVLKEVVPKPTSPQGRFQCIEVKGTNADTD